MERKTNSFKRFFGEHLLTGIDITKEYINSDGEYLNVCLIGLDGNTIKLTEDPEDGYRSHCKNIEYSDKEPAFKLPNVRVLCRALPDTDGWYNDCMEVIEIDKNAETILVVGTKNYDDYYPCCVFEYHPERLSCNKKQLNGVSIL